MTEKKTFTEQVEDITFDTFTSILPSRFVDPIMLTPILAKAEALEQENERLRDVAPAALKLANTIAKAESELARLRPVYDAAVEWAESDTASAHEEDALMDAVNLSRATAPKPDPSGDGADK